MEKEFSYQPNDGPKLKLFFDGKEVPNSDASLSEAGITADCKLDVVLEDENRPTPKPISQQVQIQQPTK